MCLKRFGGSTSSNHVHHRRFHLYSSSVFPTVIMSLLNNNSFNHAAQPPQFEALKLTFSTQRPLLQTKKESKHANSMKHLIRQIRAQRKRHVSHSNRAIKEIQILGFQRKITSINSRSSKNRRIYRMTCDLVLKTLRISELSIRSRYLCL